MPHKILYNNFNLINNKFDIAWVKSLFFSSYSSFSYTIQFHSRSKRIWLQIWMLPKFVHIVCAKFFFLNAYSHENLQTIDIGHFCHPLDVAWRWNYGRDIDTDEGTHCIGRFEPKNIVFPLAIEPNRTYICLRSNAERVLEREPVTQINNIFSKSDPYRN